MKSKRVVDVDHPTLRPWTEPRYPCDRCQRVLPISQLNHEAVIHHHARERICLDRKACERVVRKNKRQP